MVAASKPVCVLYFASLLAIISISNASQGDDAARVRGSDKPNVILIITDDQGYGDIGAHGNSMIQTPSLDAFAKQSLRLTNFHVEPTCAETRSGLMSGQFPLKVGVWHTIMGRSILKPDVKTMPQWFKDAGYRTGMFGKWHLGDNAGYRPHDRGFDKTLNHGGGGVGQTPDVWGNDYFDDVYFDTGKLSPVRGYCTDVFFDAAEEFITESVDQPFFCYLATNAPHGPFLVEESYKQPYLDKGVPEQMASFYGMITNIDDNLGDLLALLEKRDLARKTIVVFMTDNGTAAGVVRNPKEGKWNGFNAGMRGQKGSNFDGGHRVPCFIRIPGGEMSGQTYSGLAAHIDILPTLAGLCGFSVSQDQRLDGIDLLDQIRFKPDGDNERTLVVQSHRRYAPEKYRKSAVLSKRFRLIDGKELYDMSSDPGQEIDVASQHPGQVARLREAYEKWWDRCAPNPDDHSRIPIGDADEPVCTLTGHDWHGPRGNPWNQTMVRRGNPIIGQWEVQFQESCAYQLLLCRQPLAEPIPVGYDTAIVSVNGVESTFSIDPSSPAPCIEIAANAGPASLLVTLKDTNQKQKPTSPAIVYAWPKRNAKTPNLPSWLSPGSRVAWVGGTLIERSQFTGRLEGEILRRCGGQGLSFCNLGWSGDDIRGRARAVFGGVPDGWQRRESDLDIAAPNVVVIAYGMSEALTLASRQGSANIDSIQSPEQFAELVQKLVNNQLLKKRRVVLCSVPQMSSSNSQTSSILAGVQDGYNKVVGELNEKLRNLAERPNVFYLETPSLDIEWMDPSTNLSQLGYEKWCEAFSNRFTEITLQGEMQPDLSEWASEANRLFFELHRPQNETYLRLFRKREQGNNLVETQQNRPLLSHAQLEAMRLATQ